MRRVHLRGRDNILKRLLVHGAAFNLSLVLRKALGVGKPRRLQGLCLEALTQLARLFSGLWTKLPTEERRSGYFALQSSLYNANSPLSFGAIQVTRSRLVA